MKHTNPGLIPSPVDTRDYLTSSLTPDIQRYPEKYPLPFDLTILDQRSTPHCVGFASAALKQEKELRERNVKTFDGDWIYGEAKKIDNYDGDGTYLRAGLKVLKNTGAKPLDEDDPSKYKIMSYAKVDDVTFENLKKHIFIYGPLLAGFRGSNEGWSNAHIRPPKKDEKQWGHAVILVGWDNNHIIGQNSWGKDFGSGGYFYFDATYLPFEAWAVVLDSINTGQPETLSGWVAQNYLQSEEFVTGQKVSPTVNLNMRTEPAGDKITTLEKGTSLLVESKPQQVGEYRWLKVSKI